jgi:Ca-activated chloride channel family protein
MRRAAIVLGLLAARLARPEAGTLIPSNRPGPDPQVLSMAEMAIDIVIDESTAMVLMRQNFVSHSASVLEGTWNFALPGRALVSDFAVWDGPVRIPGVILERKRAEENYSDLRMQSIDPGLLQAGERDLDEAKRTSVFSAKIVPIPAYGTKRIELQYFEPVQVEDGKAYFAVPLRPDAYRAQRAGHLWITLELKSRHPLRNFEITGNAYPVRVHQRTADRVFASMEVPNVDLTEDFALRYELENAGGGRLEIASHRQGQEPGVFQASALLAPDAVNTDISGPRTVIALFDTSLSMQWEKLERAWRALETLLRSLRPADHFNLIAFNSAAAAFRPAPLAAQPAAVEEALEFLRRQRLRGGTDLKAALAAGIAQSGPEPHLVLFTDGGATEGQIRTAELSAWYASQWNLLETARRPRTFVLAVGDDANEGLLRLLARHNGVIEWIRSTEPLDFKLQAFLGKIGRRPVEGLSLTSDQGPNIDLVYPLQDTAYGGSLARWVGQYKQPAARAAFAAGKLNATAELPARSDAHPFLPRVWAKARVDALIEKMNRDGEDRASIDEIIRLARKYKFVTPYTSFLAAPRALLRPRLIRPGDPVLRVRTDPAIVSVVALFPFGGEKALRYLKEEDVWQTRFLAPAGLGDGTYPVRMLLRDRDGNVYRESKSFVILSQPPTVKVRLEKGMFRRGEMVRVTASAPSTARTITARLYGVAPVPLRWNQRAGASTAEFLVPAHLPPGRYTLRVTAEDFAHNISTQEVPLEVAP